MTAKWTWHTGSLRYDDLCPACNKPLRTQQVVQWADGTKYHVGCLLDKLVADYKAPEQKTFGPYVDIFGYHP